MNSHVKSSFKSQLLKWIGNKQKFADEIISYFPKNYQTYFEPFLGSGGVLGTLAPEKAIASDIFPPLMEIWTCLNNDKETLKKWYTERYDLINIIGKKEAYKKVLDHYNENPNGADLVFILRACYGGVVRFRKKDGFMSTPCGTHNPIIPEKFSHRVDLWNKRTCGVKFESCDFSIAMDKAKRGDLVYCDPPYINSQNILYGSQSFSLKRLLDKISECKNRGVYIALSIDGTKFSGSELCDVSMPENLFEKEVFINVGRSMLRRFQMDGKSLENYMVTDRLLLTY